jgi:hypothetical protein
MYSNKEDGWKVVVFYMHCGTRDPIHLTGIRLRTGHGSGVGSIRALVSGNTLSYTIFRAKSKQTGNKAITVSCPKAP